MSVQETSRIAFADVQEKLGHKQHMVFKVILSYGALTNSEIAEKLGWPINTVTPRTNELVKKGRIVDLGRRQCSITGKQAIAWGFPKDRLF